MLNGDSVTSVHHVREESDHDDDDDSPAVFRGPGSQLNRSPTKDSGVGTGSAPNPNPTTQRPAASNTTVDTLWRTKEELVYLSPSAQDLQLSFSCALTSIEEETPRSSGYPDELVGVKTFSWRHRFSVQPHTYPRPQLFLAQHQAEESKVLLKPLVKVFSYPSPDMDCPRI